MEAPMVLARQALLKDSRGNLVSFGGKNERSHFDLSINPCIYKRLL